MEAYIAGFGNQLREAIAIGKKIKLTTLPQGIEHIVVSGLGGSGIGANMVQDFAAQTLKIPYIVSKDYDLPVYIGKKSLVIISSYSGNTEETISSMKEAIKRKARIICICSGGAIAKLAVQLKIDLILIPGGMPPRACLGYSSVQQLYILKKLKMIDGSFEAKLEESITLIEKSQKRIRVEAAKIASKIYNKIPVIYSASGTEAVAVRFRQQINENGKQLAWHHVIPEMNHNELVGWREKNENLAVIFLRNEHDHPRSQTRMALNKKVIRKYTSTIIDIQSKGDSRLARVIYLVHLTDWISWYLSIDRKMDCVEVNVIDWLKGELKKA
jgi:glucose/mannose-6-phosphate isomerase